MQAYLPQHRDPRAIETPRGAPDPYVLYDARRVQDKTKMLSEGRGIYSYLMYIPCIPGEDTGEPPCVLFTDAGDWRVDKMSVHSSAYKTLALAPPEVVELTALRVSTDPPSSGQRRIPRTIRLGARAGYRPMAGHLLPCPRCAPATHTSSAPLPSSASVSSRINSPRQPGLCTTGFASTASSTCGSRAPMPPTRHLVPAWSCGTPSPPTTSGRAAPALRMARVPPPRYST